MMPPMGNMSKRTPHVGKYASRYSAVSAFMVSASGAEAMSMTWGSADMQYASSDCASVVIPAGIVVEVRHCSLERAATEANTAWQLGVHSAVDSAHPDVMFVVFARSAQTPAQSGKYLLMLLSSSSHGNARSLRFPSPRLLVKCAAISSANSIALSEIASIISSGVGDAMGDANVMTRAGAMHKSRSEALKSILRAL